MPPLPLSPTEAVPVELVCDQTMDKQGYDHLESRCLGSCDEPEPSRFWARAECPCPVTGRCHSERLQGSEHLTHGAEGMEPPRVAWPLTGCAA